MVVRVACLSSMLLACVAVDESTTTDVTSAVTHAVVPEKELVITDPSVIAAPIETTFDPLHPSGASKHGAWSFGRLVHNMLPAANRDSAAAASRFVFAWLATWETPQAPNPAVIPAPARSSIRLLVTNPWKQASGCADPASPATDATCVLDMAKAPFSLMAIVYRPDLRVVAGDDRSIGGEGRFVFQVVGPTLGVSATSGAIEVMDPAVKPQKLTVIFEYSLPVFDDGQILTWAHRWHQLGKLPFGPAYNAHLHGLTRDFAGPDQDPRRPNGNALNQLRTNEVALMGARFPADGFVGARQFWELREFRLTTTGLVPHTMNLEPSRELDVAKPAYVAPEGTRSAELATFLSTNAAAVLARRHALPAWMSANSSLVGSSPYGAWGKRSNTAPGGAHDLEGVDIGVRDAFALETCAGCHRHETDTRHFMHITFVGAMEPSDKATDRERIGVADAADSDVALSSFLRAEIESGGPRFQDLTALLATSRSELRDKPGLRACR